jgi:hypothetical protein
MRVINKEFSKAFNLTLNKYKYLTEFRVKDLDLIKNNKNILDNNDIRIELLLDNLFETNNSKNPIKLERVKRATRPESITKRVVGRYASYNDVIYFYKIKSQYFNILNLK